MSILFCSITALYDPCVAVADIANSVMVLVAFMVKVSTDVARGDSVPNVPVIFLLLKFCVFT